MNTSPTYSSATTPPRPPPGGTAATPPQNATYDDRFSFLYDQSSREQHQTLSTVYSATASPIDDNLILNSQHRHSTTDSPRSSRSSRSTRSSPPVISPCSSSFSPSSARTVPLKGLVENFAHMNIDSSAMTSEQARSTQRGSRIRDFPSPLPSAPPSTPASTIMNHASFSQPNSLTPNRLPSGSASGLSPAPSCSTIFASPLAGQCSDSDFAEQDGETSDSNSIEIISGYSENSFVTGRFDIKEGGNPLGQFQPARLSGPNASPPASNSAASSVDASLLARPFASASITTCGSQTPTSQILPQSTPSPTHSGGSSNFKARTVSSSGSDSSAPYLSLSKSPSPSRAQPRSGAHVESLTPSQASSPINLNSAACESVQESQFVPQVASTSDHDTEENLRTPNVYINGLPPHFPDESLYIMTRDFGHVLSVRTFTRCVGEKMSGYGFVLFDSIESAERCIETLRKYRNLHPSFSKQVHKIPGTPYASGVITLPPAGSLSSLSTQPSLSSMASFPSMASTLISSSTVSSLTTASSMNGLGHRAADSISTTSGSEEYKGIPFREKMEKLKDAKSTNLYMEGLPLTIDDVSLAALVSPHKIVSSRFFQTKLSDPPRMIAFVRLENRPAAEEVIERLHSRVVRGWNDNGCRISVRFADSNEQRELRRAERLARGEEEDVGDATRLSMAHAALLNLRGAEAQVQLNAHSLQHQAQLPHFDLAHTPTAFLNTKLARNAASTTEFGSVGSFHSVAPALRNAGMNSEVHHVHCAAPPSGQKTRVHGVHTMGRANTLGDLDAHMTSMDDAMTKTTRSSGMHLPLGGGALLPPISAKSIETTRLALLQHQTQLQQLQLLQQMQNAASRPEWQSIDSNYAINNHAHVQSQALMPSVDIFTTQMNSCQAQGGEGRHSVQTTFRDQQVPRAHIQRHVRSCSKSGLSDLSATTVPQPPSAEQYRGRRASNEDYLARHEHQRVANQHPTLVRSHARLCVDHPEELISGAGRRHANILEEGEIVTVSPALTYASRTPSTLSPATPLFNTFGTPASAPAAVPLGKTVVREREHHRTYRNEFRQ
ncbi:hypothetical protein M0805_003307 [Coniferiporia weirii]|nr:hypothetical protein M0805_003307 [Coniferiporia weirii]